MCKCSKKKTIEIKIKLVNENAQMPIKAHDTDACYDLRSVEDCVIEPGKTKCVDTGFQMALPHGYEAQIRSRSGLALKKGIIVFNTPGTIDADYRNNVGVILRNASHEPFEIKIGDRIAQMKISEVPATELIPVETLDETERGMGGFGHTGVK